ncbi:hypothetical protein KCU65_g6148, partial [Aureobasidium melanogenum]
MVLVDHLELDQRVTQAHRDARYQRLQRAGRDAGRMNFLLDDATRECAKQANLAVDKKDRFRKLPLVGEINGCTDEAAPHLPGEIAYLLCDNNLNYTYRDSRSVTISDSAINFKESFYFAQEREKAHLKREQSNALCNFKQRGILTAEAVMVARHKGAWRVTLRIAKTNKIYQDREVVALPANELRPAAALAILANLNHTYETETPQEVVAHTCAFYGAYNNRLPPELRAADHLDLFIWRYDGQIFIGGHQTKPELDNTLGILDPDTLINVLAGALAENANNVARFDQLIIQFADLSPLRQMSPIAAKDALPDQLRQVVLDRLATMFKKNQLPSDVSNECSLRQTSSNKY